MSKNDVTLVIDEAHHSIAPSYLNIINLAKKQNDNKVKLLGLTATPTRINEEEEAKLWKLYKDKKAYEIGLDELISQGFLAYPRFIPINTNIDVIKELDLSDVQIASIIEKDDIAKGLGKDIVKKISENAERNNFIVQHYIQNKAKYGKTLIFAIDVLNAIALNKLFKQHKIKSDFVVSSTVDFQGNSNARQENHLKIESFDKGEIDVLLNVQIMTEGTDIPSIQTIFLTRPTNSKTLMTQMMGRGLRGEKAGGTKEAFIVSFIDEWQDKIYWGNAEEILIAANLDLDTKSPTYRKMVKQLVSIDLLEQFILSQSQESEDYFDHTEFSYFIPLGFYHFDVEYNIDEADSVSKNISILVYDNMQNGYIKLMNDLDTIIKKSEKVSDSELVQFVLDQYFKNIPQIPTVKKDNILDLIKYYKENKKKPSFVTFEDRDKYDLEVLAEPFANIDSDKERKKKIEESYYENEFLKEFYKDYSSYKKLIDKIILRLNDPQTYSYNQDVTIEFEQEDISEKTLQEIKSINYNYYSHLREETFKTSLEEKNDEMFYACAKCRKQSKSKSWFQIDHIKSRDKEGKTTLDNLQVLCVSCNRKKGNK